MGLLPGPKSGPRPVGLLPGALMVWLLPGPLVDETVGRPQRSGAGAEFTGGQDLQPEPHHHQWACPHGTGLHSQSGIPWSRAPQGFTASYLSPKTPTKALLPIDSCHIIVFVEGQRLEPSYSTISLTALPRNGSCTKTVMLAAVLCPTLTLCQCVYVYISFHPPPTLRRQH